MQDLYYCRHQRVYLQEKPLSSSLERLKSAQGKNWFRLKDFLILRKQDGEMKEHRKQAVSKMRRHRPVSAQRVRAEWLCRNPTQRHGLREVENAKDGKKAHTVPGYGIGRHLPIAVARLVDNRLKDAL